MIAFIKGILDEIAGERIYVDNQGIGFEIFVPGSVVRELPAPGTEVKIHTYMHIREDVMQLYGFLTQDELNMFRLLITVNGVGPKGALAILTVMDTEALKLAVLSDDAKAISKAPGIGGKTASKIILELKDKCSLEDVLNSGAGGSGSSFGNGAGTARNEAMEALVALGYSASEAASAVRSVKITPEMTVEEILKNSLRYM